MHIGGSLHRQHAGVSPIHLAEILAATEDQTQQTAGEAPSADGRARS